MQGDGGNPDCPLRSVAIFTGVVFERLRLWIDPVERSGPEAMAVDEWLLETADSPVLRVYRWLGEWGSVGYFGNLVDARASLPGLSWVRRWTGGGTVDHRADWTYSVVSPAGSALAGMKGAESYRILHEALVAALRDEGLTAILASGASATGESLCFRNPVGHDLVDSSGAKIAGAGQRRTRRGVLHQGSVACLPAGGRGFEERAHGLAGKLAEGWETADFRVPTAWLEEKVGARYGNPHWLAGKRGE